MNLDFGFWHKLLIQINHNFCLNQPQWDVTQSISTLA